MRVVPHSGANEVMSEIAIEIGSAVPQAQVIFSV
jgi:hypothetical protein